MRSIKYFLIILFLIQPAVTGQTNEDSNKLSEFERLTGGEWISDNSKQTFEWGVGKKSVIAKSYFMIDDEWKLVAEGVWFWHHGEEKIKGYFTAIDMPVELFDYTTEFIDNTFVSNLKAYSPSGTVSDHIEEWEMIEENKFLWTLYSVTPENEKTKIMEGTFVRVVKTE